MGGQYYPTVEDKLHEIPKQKNTRFLPVVLQLQGKYSLQDLKRFVDFLIEADIALVRLEYLCELQAKNGRVPCRQEAETEMTAAGNSALVSKAELRRLEFDYLGSNPTISVMKPRPGRVRVKFESISHCWESMEHPDPHGFQLNSIIKMCPPETPEQQVWIFFDFVSLYQFGGRTEFEERCFRRALEHMHTLYAHEGVQVRIIDDLTPDDQKHHRSAVLVYSEANGGMTMIPAEELKINVTPYHQRGWCVAERQWASLRISLEVTVPMPPDLFRERIIAQGLKFTHHDDMKVVLHLQAKVFQEKTFGTKTLEVENLDAETSEVLCAALPHYTNLEELVLNNNKVTVNVIEAAAKTPARILQLERCQLQDAHVELLSEELANSEKVQQIYIANNRFGEKGRVALLRLSEAKPALKIHGLTQEQP